MQDEFDARGIPYFNYDTYDLFYAGYGDTVPANGFGARGMTFEKANGDPPPQRVSEQYLTQWTSLSPRRSTRRRSCASWHGSWVEAVRQGAAGQLEPNARVGRPRTVQRRARPHGPPLLPARGRPGQGARGAGRSCGACSAWTSRCGG
jgi:hypothetical protein